MEDNLKTYGIIVNSLYNYIPSNCKTENNSSYLLTKFNFLPIDFNVVFLVERFF